MKKALVMVVSIRNARIFFAVSLIAWAIQHFLLGDFVAGRPQPWPENLPGKLMFAYGSGLIFLVAGVAIILNSKARILALLCGVLILTWAALPNGFTLMTSLDYGSALTRFNKALVIGSGAILVSATYRNLDSPNDSVLDNVIRWSAPFAKYFVGFFLMASGVQHFLFASVVRFLVPAWMGGAYFWTYFAGVALIVSGLAIIVSFYRPLAALLSSCMILIWVVLLHLPRALGENGNANEWTAVFEALATSALLMIIYQQSKSVKEHDQATWPSVYKKPV